MSDTIDHNTIGFDGPAYIKKQADAIHDRLEKFPDRLYMEVGGHFLYDAHASRVLPGFDPSSKQKIFEQFADQMDIIYCINAKDIVRDRQLTSTGTSYTDYVLDKLKKIEKSLGIQPRVVITMSSVDFMPPDVREFTDLLKEKEYSVFRKFLIDDYPDDVDTILSEDGFGKDEYIPVENDLVIVTGAASNSGKLGTCLSQLYLEHLEGTESGYAKYETFPIQNLSLDHPVNLAYEAATADIGDYNVIDTYHKKHYHIDCVNYNRDVEAFEILMQLGEQFLAEDNYVNQYHSPTDMGINTAGDCIIDDAVCRQAAIEEIQRRRDRYQTMANRNIGEPERANRCDELLKKVK